MSGAFAGHSGKPICLIAPLILNDVTRQMVDRFGAEYLEYQERVPMFFPHWEQWAGCFNFAQVREGRPSRNGFRSEPIQGTV